MFNKIKKYFKEKEEFFNERQGVKNKIYTYCKALEDLGYEYESLLSSTKHPIPYSPVKAIQDRVSNYSGKLSEILKKAEKYNLKEYAEEKMHWNWYHMEALISMNRRAITMKRIGQII